MKIIIVYQYFGTPSGGWSTRIYELSKRWLKKGAEITVITSPYYKSDIRSSGLISKQIVDGINLIVIDSEDSNKIRKRYRIIRALKFALISSYYVLSLRADVVIASSGPITVGIPGLFSRWFTKKKFIFEVRDLWPRGAVEMKLIRNRLFTKFGFLFEKICYKNASIYFGNSD
jgi:glycosyltransferase involved in cell wall biosynthesis